jgi:hypothetical protein
MSSTAKGVRLMSKLTLIGGRAVKAPVIWQRQQDFMAEALAVFNDFTPLVNWKHTGQDNPYFGNTIVGTIRALVLARLLPVDALDLEDCLDGLWAEVFGVALFNQGGLLIFGDEKRELTICVEAKIGGQRAWVRGPALRGALGLPPISVATLRAARQFVKGYRGPALRGELDGPHSDRLCRYLGISVFQVGNEAWGVVGKLSGEQLKELKTASSKGKPRAPLLSGIGFGSRPSSSPTKKTKRKERR